MILSMYGYTRPPPPKKVQSCLKARTPQSRFLRIALSDHVTLISTESVREPTIFLPQRSHSDTYRALSTLHVIPTRYLHHFPCQAGADVELARFRKKPLPRHPKRTFFSFFFIPLPLELPHVTSVVPPRRCKFPLGDGCAYIYISSQSEDWVLLRFSLRRWSRLMRVPEETCRAVGGDGLITRPE